MYINTNHIGSYVRLLSAKILRIQYKALVDYLIEGDEGVLGREQGQSGGADEIGHWAFGPSESSERTRRQIQARFTD